MREFQGKTRRLGPNREIAVVEISGGVFISNFTDFKEMLDKFIEQRVNHIILNLSGLDFISSTAIGAILETNGKLARRGGRLILVAVSPEINRVLEFLYIHQLLDVMDSETEAVEELLQPPSNSN